MFASGCHKEKDNVVAGADKKITLRPTIAMQSEARMQTRAPQLNGIGSG